jgi:hypothetical protein
MAQFVHLAPFRQAFFLEGYTGLAIKIGAIVTLVVAMQLAGRVRWADRLRKREAPLRYHLQRCECSDSFPGGSGGASCFSHYRHLEL